MPKEATLQSDVIEQDVFYHHVIDGLTQTSKTLHPKYFYDQEGSELYDQICALEEYYPYRTELNLLPKVARDLAKTLKEQYALVEFGAGSLLKVKPILSEIADIKQFIPIDISGEHLRASCRELEKEFNSLNIKPIEGDFTQTVEIHHNPGLKKLGFFPGSTIGNFLPEDAKDFLINARESLGKNSYILIGVDTKKSPARLHQAYNDKQGVTANFNLNILDRINRHFDDPIDRKKFEHYAFYNTGKGCIEMHLVCLEDYSFYLDNTFIEFSKGESIHTESSYKYTPKEFQTLALGAGWKIEKVWLAENDLFSAYLLKNSG